MAILSQIALILGGLVVNQVRFVFFLTALSALAFVACGNSACAMRKNSGSGRGKTAGAAEAVTPASPIAPRVATSWQKAFLQRAAELKAKEAWGLFSEAGWADDGQTMIYVLPDGSAQVEAVLPGGRAVKDLTPVSAADVLALKKDLAPLDGLEDYVPAAFDALLYEMVHLVPVGDSPGLDVKTRIMAVRVDPEKAPRHMAVVDVVRSIRDARAPK